MRLTLSAALATLCPLFAAVPAHAHDPSPGTVQFSGCREFVGVAPVDAVKARAVVPARYSPVVAADGARLVVRVADCSAVRVGSAPARPGRVAQVGVIIVSPDGTATDPATSINNYTLTYSTDSPLLAATLRAAGVPATLDRGLAIETTPPDAAGAEFYAAVSPEFDRPATWFLHGRVNPPTVATSFLANWWRLDGGRETKMATEIALIRFDFASTMRFATSRANVIGRLVGANGLDGFPLSFHGLFAAGTMTVTTTRP